MIIKDNTTRHWKLAPVRSKRSNWLSRPRKQHTTLAGRRASLPLTPQNPQRAQEPAPPGGLGVRKKTETKHRQSSGLPDQPSTLPSPQQRGNKIDSLDKGKEGVSELKDNQGFLQRLLESRRIKWTTTVQAEISQSLTLTFLTSLMDFFLGLRLRQENGLPRLWKAQVSFYLCVQKF